MLSPLVEPFPFGSRLSCLFCDCSSHVQSVATKVLSKASGKTGKIRALFQQATVNRSRSGMPVAEDEEPAVA